MDNTHKTVGETTRIINREDLYIRDYHFKKNFKNNMNTTNFQNYTKAVRKFIEDTKEWGGVDDEKFYTCEMTTGEEQEIIGDWEETPDNAQGGLDVQWAIGKTPSDIEILEHYIRELELKAGLYTC